MCAGPGKRQFLQSLDDYDKDNIPENIVEHVEKLIKDDENPIRPGYIQMCSLTFAAFAKWAVAMVSYHHVSRFVGPLWHR